MLLRELNSFRLAQGITPYSPRNTRIHVITQQIDILLINNQYILNCMNSRLEFQIKLLNKETLDSALVLV